MDDPRFVDTLQAAALADRCPETIRRWVRSRKLRAYRPRHSNRLYFRPVDVRAAIKKEEIEV